MINVAALQSAFQNLYGKPPRLFSAPGRVNLIGEHTDYNDGFVLPMAINRRTFVAAAQRDDRHVCVRSLDIEADATFELDEKSSAPQEHWLAYVEGVARVLEQRGATLTGAEIAISSEIPMGAGLSSSAALEISAGTAFIALSRERLDPVQLALAAQTAEQVYAGTKCGIMDHLTATLGQKAQALLIDCRSLNITPIDLNLPGIAIVVCNTNVKHELASSAYNERRAECERGVEILHEKMPDIRALRDVSMADLNRYAQLLPEPVRRRCRHIVTENERTLRAADALRGGDVEQLGKLMKLSHQSLRDDYEVSCPELDTMVEIAMQQEGVAGARMTGGGFGGCTVNLVHRDVLKGFQECVVRDYHQATGLVPAIYIVEADVGVREHMDIVSIEEKSVT
jgi:galactokinase